MLCFCLVLRDHSGMSTARDLATRYFAAWGAREFDALRGVLAEDVSFRGPLGEAEGAEACIRGLRGMSEGVGLPEVRVIAAEGDDVLTWFELHTEHGLLPVANWSRVEHGRIVRVRATFDPRPILG
jgi:ketosteroid isomerase-like protein